MAPPDMAPLPVTQSGQGEALVLVHGWSMNMSVWQLVLPVLEQHYQVYRVDLPGHGSHEQVPPSELAEEFDAWLQAVMQVVPERATWMGWSLGATIALAIASRCPERVSELKLVAGTAKFVASADWPHAVPEKTWTRFVNAFAEDPQLANQQFMQLQSLGVVGPRKLGKLLQSMQQEGGVPSNQGMMLGLKFLAEIDLRQALQQLQCPVQLLLGAQDKLVAAAVAADMQALNFKIKVDVIADAGHVPFVSHPEEFLKALDL